MIVKHEIQDAGARILTVIEDKALLTSMFPTVEQRERCEVSARLLEKAKVLRLTNRAGTDITPCVP
jgi:2,5-dihydroxypyridine 5,6-dioxygenase